MYLLSSLVVVPQDDNSRSKASYSLSVGLGYTQIISNHHTIHSRMDRQTSDDFKVRSWWWRRKRFRGTKRYFLSHFFQKAFFGRGEASRICRYMILIYVVYNIIVYLYIRVRIYIYICMHTLDYIIYFHLYIYIYLCIHHFWLFKIDPDFFF